MNTIYLIAHQNPLNLTDIQQILHDDMKLELSEESKAKIIACRSYLDEKSKSFSDPIYGINTGFGALCNVKIKDENLQKLQENLVKSHACGTGERVPNEIVRLMLLFKIKSLSFEKYTHRPTQDASKDEIRRLGALATM